jgi:hypothetical protein
MRAAFRHPGPALLCFALLACKRTPEISEPAQGHASPSSASAEPLAAATDASPCRLRIPQTDEPVAVFPAEEGARAFAEGLVGAGDEIKLARAMHQHNAFFVDVRTPCTRLGTNRDGTYTKVRVLGEGPESNKLGWVDSTWTKAEP